MNVNKWEDISQEYLSKSSEFKFEKWVINYLEDCKIKLWHKFQLFWLKEKNKINKWINNYEIEKK